MKLCQGAKRGARRRSLHEREVSYDQVKWVSPTVIASGRRRVQKVASVRAAHRARVAARKVG